jgi:GWxTD domain-containing protein
MVRKAAVLFALLALPLAAADLGKYKTWADSPAAYFLTSAERAEWSKLQTEADAEAFVQKFTAARGGEKFTAELAKRVEKADTYLTVGKSVGSTSTRGKVIIVLGPPQAMQVAAKPIAKAGRSGTTSMATSGGTRDGGTSASDMADVAQRDAMSGEGAINIYTFTYPNLIVPVEVNAANGKDKIRDRKAAEAFERAVEEAAKASIVVK